MSSTENTAPGAGSSQPATDFDPYPTTTTTTATEDNTQDNIESRTHGRTERVSDDARDDARAALDEVRRFTHDAKDKAREQWDEARGQFESAKSDLAHRWNEQKGRLGQRAQAIADEQKGRVCSGVNDAASAARAAAEELRRRDDPTIAGYAEAAADQLERVRDYLQNAQLSDLGREAASLMRSRPEWVLGGAFVAGLAIARFLKAGKHGGMQGDGPPASANESLFQDAIDQQYAPTSRTGYYGSSTGVPDAESELESDAVFDTDIADDDARPGLADSSARMSPTPTMPTSAVRHGSPAQDIEPLELSASNSPTDTAESDPESDTSIWPPTAGTTRGSTDDATNFRGTP